MMRRSRPDHSYHREMRAVNGLTLIEVLVATLLLALVAAGLVPLLATGQQTWDAARRQEEMVFNARIALDSLVSTIRAGQTLQVISPTDIKLTYFFGDGTTIPTEEYILDPTSNELQYRWNADAPAPFAGPFRSMSEVCFDASNTSISCSCVVVSATCPTAVISIQVSLVAMDPEGQVPDVTVTSRVFVQYP